MLHSSPTPKVKWLAKLRLGSVQPLDMEAGAEGDVVASPWGTTVLGSSAKVYPEPDEGSPEGVREGERGAAWAEDVEDAEDAEDAEYAERMRRELQAHVHHKGSALHPPRAARGDDEAGEEGGQVEDDMLGAEGARDAGMGEAVEDMGASDVVEDIGAGGEGEQAAAEGSGRGVGSGAPQGEGVGSQEGWDEGEESDVRRAEPAGCPSLTTHEGGREGGTEAHKGPEGCAEAHEAEEGRRAQGYTTMQQYDSNAHATTQQYDEDDSNAYREDFVYVGGAWVSGYRSIYLFMVPRRPTCACLQRVACA